MDWEEHLRLRNRVVSVIRGYQDLKEIYSQFVDSFKEQVSSSKDYVVSIASEDETHIILKVFDDLLRMTFSFVVVDRTVYGKLTFNRGTTEDPEHVFTLFFDDGGNIRPNPMTLQYSQNLLGKNGAGLVLLLALHSYINLSRFALNEEASNGTR